MDIASIFFYNHIANMSKKEVNFTSRDMEVLALAWQCMETQPKIDMNKLALLTGYTPGSASVTFGKIKQKLKLLGEARSSSGPAPPKNGHRAQSASSAPSTPRKRTAATTTPSSSAKKAKQFEQTAEDEEDDEEDDFGGGFKGGFGTGSGDGSATKVKMEVKKEKMADKEKEKEQEDPDFEEVGFRVLGDAKAGRRVKAEESDFLGGIEKFSS
ncbi:gpi transamidase component pig-u [Pyrenophora seminiperda CCB06]|uniref:Gpi transamidase component pig-u n=1 Tax=Pyrenophora seminiperda CCB06 TaxID=1302712 RepID=A0A3M7M4I0_9PLEO|nr:gpi transamidase component pig-u [Pyrenophora seminiperda CCB06]